jgi:hypothetical protein
VRASATNRYKSLHALSPSQSLALDALDAGRTHGEAAEVAGVDRTTVSRWTRHHPAFVAELNRRKVERADRNQRRIDEVTVLAIEAVAAAVAGGDIATAIQWLKIREPTTVSEQSGAPTSPEAVIERRRASFPSMLSRLLLADEDNGATTEDAVNAILATLGSEDDA